MKKLEEKVIIIMGASSGIGEATTRLLAEKGAKLIIAARRIGKLKALSASLPNATVDYLQADVTQIEEVQKVADFALEKYGHIDVLFNNAGIMPTAPLIEGRRDEWQNMLDINIMGVLNGIAAVLPTMVEQKSGHIIATGSVAGHVISPNSVVYSGTKFAVNAIMEGLRQEQRHNNIKSTVISPGAVATELYTTVNDKDAAQEMYEAQRDNGLIADDIANAVLFVIDTPERMSVSDMIVRPTTKRS